MPSVKNTHSFSSMNTTALEGQLTVFNSKLEERRELFFRLPPESRQRLIAADPVLGKAYQMYLDFKEWFGDLP